jgi:hypothetical protein
MPSADPLAIVVAMGPDPVVSATAAALIAGYLMTAAGLHKRLLYRRRPRRRCPACWHEQGDCVCRGSHRRHGWHRSLLR